MRRRLQASAALLLLVAAVALTVVVAVEGFPRGFTVFACLVLALAAAWWGLVRRGAARMVAFSVAALLLAGAVIVTVFEGRLVADAVIVAAFALSIGAAPSRGCDWRRQARPDAPRAMHR